MLQLVPSQRPPLAVIRGGLGETSTSDPLLTFAGSVTGSHALVIAPNGLDLLCNLLRHGCAAATSQRLAERSEHEAYDLVFAPSVASAPLVARLICQAKRALVPTGRFLAFVPAMAIDHEEVGALLVQSMRLGGFAAIQAKETQGGLLVRGDLPMLGISSAMPSLTRRHA
jgi:hypothetical protein